MTRTGGSFGAVGVDYATVDGTATATNDYAATSGTLNFADGVLSQTFNVPVLNDTIYEGDEAFSVGLSNASGGASIGAPAAATVTIAEDDPAAAAVADTIYLTTMDGVVSSANGVLANDLPDPALADGDTGYVAGSWHAGCSSMRTARLRIRLTLTRPYWNASRHSRITTTTECWTAILRRQRLFVSWRYPGFGVLCR